MREKSKDLRIIDTIRKDLTEEDLFRKLRNEFLDIREFYIDSEKQMSLNKMNRVKRFFYMVWWILKGMFFKLNPLRRILLLLAIVLMFGSNSFVYTESDIKLVIEDDLIGALLILFVLMLELKDKLLAHEELDAGRKVQLALLPDSKPVIPGWDVFLFTKPANNVGGDLIDFMKIGSDSNYGITIADVAGNGLKSALLASRLQTLIHISMDGDEMIEEKMNKLNRFFFKETLRSIFASLVFIEVKSDDSKLKFVNAGHFPPIFLKQNENGFELIEFEKGDSAIGLMENIQFKPNEIEMKENEIFVAYSDGLIEAQNEFGQFFGLERLKKILFKNSHLDAEKLCGRIVLSLENFVNDAKQNDDISLVVIRKSSAS